MSLRVKETPQLREQDADVLEMSFDEINIETSDVSIVVREYRACCLLQENKKALPFG